MLIGAGVRQSYSPAVRLGQASIFVINRIAWAQPGAQRNFWAGEATVIAGASIANKSAFPVGYLHPGAWLLAPKSGGMACRTIEGAGEITFANLAGGKAIIADLEGAGDITSAAVGLIVSVIAALSGAATLTVDMFGALDAAADLVGDGDLACAMGALANLLADLTGDTALAAAFTAKASMSADITVAGATLTTANVADAVWSAVAESGLSYEQVIRILLAVAAGKTQITDLGGGNAEVAFRDVADSKDRVFAEMVGSERDVVTLDGD